MNDNRQEPYSNRRMNAREWTHIITAVLGIVTVAGMVGLWAGDVRWATNEKLAQATQALKGELNQLEINALGRQITFLKIKVSKNEASDSEKTVLPILEQQLQELKDEKTSK